MSLGSARIGLLTPTLLSGAVGALTLGSSGSGGGGGGTILTFTVGPNTYNDFSDIQSAIDAATGATSHNPISIQVEEGVYDGFSVNTNYVSVIGKGMGTIIKQNFNSITLNSSFGELLDMYIVSDIWVNDGFQVKITGCHMDGNIHGPTTNGSSIILGNLLFGGVGQTITLGGGAAKVFNVSSADSSTSTPDLSISDKCQATINDCEVRDISVTANGGSSTLNIMGCRVIGNCTITGVGVMRIMNCIFENNFTLPGNPNPAYFYLVNCYFFGPAIIGGGGNCQHSMFWNQVTSQDPSVSPQATEFYHCQFGYNVADAIGSKWSHCYFVGTFDKVSPAHLPLNMYHCVLESQLTIGNGVSGNGTFASNNFLYNNIGIIDNSSQAFASDGHNTFRGGAQYGGGGSLVGVCISG